MFPLTLEGDWTAAVSKRGWVGGCVRVGGVQELMDPLHSVTEGVFPGQGRRNA